MTSSHGRRGDNFQLRPVVVDCCPVDAASRKKILVSGFDIRTILQFQPPKYLCEACRGLFEKLEHVDGGDPWDDRRCPVCNCVYVKGEFASEGLGVYKYLKE